MTYPKSKSKFQVKIMVTEIHPRIFFTQRTLIWFLSKLNSRTSLQSSNVIFWQAIFVKSKTSFSSSNRVVVVNLNRVQNNIIWKNV